MEQNNIYKSVFKVTHSGGSGSCFYLKAYDLFVTNYHVTEGFRTVAIHDNERNPYLAKVVLANPAMDIALLAAEGDFSSLPDISLAEDDTLTIGRKVYVAGYPYGMPFTITEGSVSSPKQLMDGKYYIQTDAAVNPGNSGGPILDEDNRVVGVTVSKFTQADNMGFGIRVETLHALLDTIGDLDRTVFQVQCGSCEELISHAQPLLRYAIDRAFSKYDLSDFGQKSRALADGLSLLAPIKHSVLAQEYAGYIADRLHYDIGMVTEKLAGFTAPRTYDQAPAEAALAPLAQPVVSLPPRERERLRIEREFLALCARHADVGLAYADALVQTIWHRDAHRCVAQALIAYLAEHPEASSPGEVVRGVSAMVEGAASTLTAASLYDDIEPEQLARFLADELAIRDMEDSIAAVNAQLKHPEDMAPEEYEQAYQDVVMLQRELVALRSAHRPLGSHD